MNILVTGGFGFIGTNLVEELLKNPANHIQVVDNLQSPPINYVKFLKEINYPNINLSYSLQSLQDYIADHPYKKFDVIYHLASPVGPAGVLKYAGQMIDMVVNDAYCLMRHALRTDADLIDISTSEVYGGGKEGLCSESFDKVIPAETTIRLEYAIGKLAAETAIINSCRVNGLRAAIIRPFNVTGQRQSWRGGFVLPRFIKQAMAGDPLTVFGDGTQIRAFTHVKDMVDGIMLVAEHADKNGKAWNLGNPDNKTRIIDLAHHVLSVTGSHSKIRYVDPKDIYGDLYAEAAEKYPDSTRAFKELLWEPCLGIEDTIYDSFQYMKANYNDFI